MKPFVIGTREDVTGFALAGVAGVVCESRDDAKRAIERADRDTLLILSAECACDTSRIHIVLPERAR